VVPDKHRREAGQGHGPRRVLARVEVVRQVPPGRVAAEDGLLGVQVARVLREVRFCAVAARRDAQDG
jgi:hypothetical protein